MLVTYSIVVIVLYILSSHLKNKFAILFCKIFPKVLIPIVLFQTIASVLKISSAGLPFTRYYVILYGLFALYCGILFGFTKVKRNGLIAPVLIILLLLSLIPPIDALSVGKRNQIQMLETVLKANNMLENKKILPDSGLSEKDKEKITQSTEYIFSMGYQNELEYLGEDFNFYDDFHKHLVLTLIMMNIIIPQKALTSRQTLRGLPL
jgi:hypothetical protein